jgi:hypothetical protein
VQEQRLRVGRAAPREAELAPGHAAVGLEDARGDEPHLGLAVEHRAERVEVGRGHARVGVEQQHVVGVDAPDPDVAAGGEPAVLGRGHGVDVEMGDRGERGVGRGVVDHRHVDAVERDERLDAVGEGVGAVVGDDDRMHAGRRLAGGGLGRGEDVA